MPSSSSSTTQLDFSRLFYFPLNGSVGGLNPGYLRRPDPSLIALGHDTVSKRHDCADALTQAHLPAFVSAPLALGDVNAAQPLSFCQDTWINLILE